MVRKKKFEPDDPEQSARFIELAEQVQAEDAGERFEEAMKKIAQARSKRPHNSSPKQDAS
jgi:hypothetical protein